MSKYVITLIAAATSILLVGEPPPQEALNSTQIVALIASGVAMLVSIVGLIGGFVRDRRASRSSDAEDDLASQRSAEISSAARLRLELRVEEQNKQIAALVQQQVEKGPKYSVQFLLDTAGASPTIANVNIQKLAVGDGIIMQNDKPIASKPDA